MKGFLLSQLAMHLIACSHFGHKVFCIFEKAHSFGFRNVCSPLGGPIAQVNWMWIN